MVGVLATAMVGIGPEAITLGRGPIRGRVVDREPHGRETLYLVESEVGPLPVVEPGATARLAPGETVRLGWATSLLFDAASGRRLEGGVVAEGA
jgi:inositol-phosphate transport system ATP-binding protein